MTFENKLRLLRAENSSDLKGAMHEFKDKSSSETEEFMTGTEAEELMEPKIPSAERELKQKECV